jgi:hypothetical protein
MRALKVLRRVVVSSEPVRGLCAGGSERPHLPEMEISNVQALLNDELCYVIERRWKRDVLIQSTSVAAVNLRLVPPETIVMSTIDRLSLFYNRLL